MPLFTPQNAREMQLRAAKARTAIREPEPEPPQIAEPVAVIAESFTDRRLARVRQQLSLVDDAIEREASKREPDGQRLDRLSAASMRLSDQEFALANRPKPGQLRPISPRSRPAPAQSYDPQPSPSQAPSPGPATTNSGPALP